MTSPIRVRLWITGVVQGVGFRPFVWQLAQRADLAGFTRNATGGVTVELQGSQASVDRFLDELTTKLPPLARIDSLSLSNIPFANETAFAILDSHRIEGTSTPAAPDMGACEDCVNELYDAADRRHGYPFINCTNCGPRFTIVTDLPYDRITTTMRHFSMCSDCQREYDNPLSRRFHAQPNACSLCGPKVWWSSDGSATNEPPPNALPTEALESFAQALSAGQIVAVKGIGGFHLACDPANPAAVAELRGRKGRSDKPFAIMVKNVEEARQYASVSPSEAALLESQERPIVLLPKRSGTTNQLVLESVAPGNDFIGVLLPYSPIHHLLLDLVSPILLTSGNLSDEPIASTNEEAVQRLGTIADAFLMHDRDIHCTCDDSIVRCIDGLVVPLRRARGYAPLPIQLREAGGRVLAIGGEIKTALCVTRDDYAYMSQHIGDVGNIETLTAFSQIAKHFETLFRAPPQIIAGDMHPEYLSARWARQYAARREIPYIAVQHHHAHVAALHAEHRLDCEQRIIGCCFDGTGFGTDGTIWGGEFLVASPSGFERFAHLEPVQLPSGDSSIKNPYRIALALLRHAEQDWASKLPCVACVSADERSLISQQLKRSINCVQSSSAGRLFDGVASLIGIRHQITYEAQAALELEALAARSIDHVDPLAYALHSLSKPQVPSKPMIVSYKNLIEAICLDTLQGVPPERIAAQFHHAVARMIVSVCEAARKHFGLTTVGLTGGVFQNALLLKLTRRNLHAEGFRVLTHQIVPPNDGGLALGQAAIARAHLAAQMSDCMPAL